MLLMFSLALPLTLACGDKDDTGASDDGSTDGGAATDGGATTDGGAGDGGSSDGGSTDEPPVELAVLDGTDALDAAIVGDHVVIAANTRGAVLVDISDPASPVELEAYPVGTAYAVAVEDDIAWLASWDGSVTALQVVDGQFDYLGEVEVQPHAIGIDVASGTVAVASWSGSTASTDPDHGLSVVDGSKPTAPQWRGELLTPGWAGDVALDGDTAWVADGPQGIRAVDISVAAEPVELGSAATELRANGITLDDQGQVLVADDEAGLLVFDGSSSSPGRVGSLDLDGAAHAVAAQGRWAWVAADTAGLFLVDLSDPALPVQVDQWHLGTQAWGVQASGDLAVAALGKSGIALYGAR